MLIFVNKTCERSQYIPAKVKFEIYNMNGQLVKTLLNKFQKAGIYHLVWNRQDGREKLLSTGVYLYQLVVYFKGYSLKHTGKALYYNMGR